MVAFSLTVATSTVSTKTLRLPRVEDLGPTMANARTLLTVIDALLPAVVVNFSLPPDGLPAAVGALLVAAGAVLMGS